MRLNKKLLLKINKKLKKIEKKYNHEFVNKNFCKNMDNIEITIECKKCNSDLHFYYDIYNKVFELVIYENGETYDFVDFTNFKCNDIIIKSIIE